MARPIAEEFGRAFRTAYTRAGLTQVELAHRLRARGWIKVDQSQISKWVRGVSVPPLEVLPDVDDACDMPRGYVLIVAGFVEPAAFAPADDGEAKIWRSRRYDTAEKMALIAETRARQRRSADRGDVEAK